tara:strand:+ start:43101 stop:43400 length:300 start_codon:yes stop_codon:yes gene_type:complete
MNVKEEFGAMLEEAGTRLGDLGEEKREEMAAYAAERAERAAIIIDGAEPGLDEFLIAARDNLALKGSLVIGEGADAVGIEWRGLLLGGLRFAALALAGA